MSNTPVPIDITSINNTTDLVRLVEEVQKTNTPRALTKDAETLAVLVPASDIFTQLSENAQFIAEADAARQQLEKNSAALPNLSEKYAHLIKP